MLTDRGLTTKVTEEDIPNMVKDELGAFYSPDGKRLLRGVDSASFCIKPGTVVICDKAFQLCSSLRILRHCLPLELK